jgi:cell division transport system permease protein
MLDRIHFILNEAFVALRRNSMMSLAAVTTVAVSLFFLGGLAMIWINLTAFLETLPEQLDARVHLKEEVTKLDQISKVADRIRELPGVGNVYWIPRQGAWERKRLELGYGRDYPNPYTESFKVVWSDLGQAPKTTALIKRMAEVEEVVQETAIQRLVSDFLAMAKNVGIGIGGILLLTGGILIYNAIKLTIMSRRREIRIMQLVGATRATVNTPFVIEGLVQGILGGVLASMILWAIYNRLADYVNTNVIELVSIKGPFPVWPVLGLLVAAGAFYGLVCSSLALRDPARLR